MVQARKLPVARFGWGLFLGNQLYSGKYPGYSYKEYTVEHHQGVLVTQKSGSPLCANKWLKTVRYNSRA